MLKIEVAPGELIDKLSILEIKLKRISDPSKLKNIQIEHDLLDQHLNAIADKLTVEVRRNLFQLHAALCLQNEKIWEIEDSIRDKERNKCFDEGFIELARAVYINNDERAALKRKINVLLNSIIVEEKSYSQY